jgi:chromatin structure-remodeling complex subunit RSC9
MVAKQREPTAEEIEEREKFIEELQEYHKKRGLVLICTFMMAQQLIWFCRTTLDPAPKVGSVNLDLLKLYRRVTSEGGYDVVSDTKGNKLAWRRIATDFLPHNANIVTLAFQVKTAYYKNVAYG